MHINDQHKQALQKRVCWYSGNGEMWTIESLINLMWSLENIVSSLLLTSPVSDYKVLCINVSQSRSTTRYYSTIDCRGHLTRYLLCPHRFFHPRKVAWLPLNDVWWHDRNNTVAATHQFIGIHGTSLKDPTPCGSSACTGKPWILRKNYVQTAFRKLRIREKCTSTVIHAFITTVASMQQLTSFRRVSFSGAFLFILWVEDFWHWSVKIVTILTNIFGFLLSCRI